LLAELRGELRRGRYELLVVVDYPGFHLQLAKAARAAGVPVLWYVAPQLWAWYPSRAKNLAAAIDRVAVILPFEPAFFAQAGIPAEYVGHPLLDRPAGLPRDAARHSLGIPAGATVLTVLPGSRPGEITRLWPAYQAAAAQLLETRACTH